MDAADVDDSGGVRPELTDAINLLNWLFLGGARPPAPTPSMTAYSPGDCGPDPTPGDAMDCASFPPCDA